MIYWRLKGCTRCGGDMMVDGEDSRCLQCGHEPVEATAYALADQERRWEPPAPAIKDRGRWERRLEPPMRAVVGQGKWERGGGNPSGNTRPGNTGRNIAIRELRDEGVSLKKVAIQYGLTSSAVSLIARGMR